ncbi:hypothetical protein D9M72_626370 [compost metagenome]
MKEFAAHNSRHPQPLHYNFRTLVRQCSKSVNAGHIQGAKCIIESRASCFGRITLAPIVATKSPPHL